MLKAVQENVRDRRWVEAMEEVANESLTEARRIRKGVG